MSDPENDSKVRRGPKHMRLRYYTSYEEATIVKVWREHLHEITSYTENLSIFREIAFGLQQHRIRLNKQEVRRRISSYRNKYLLERSRLESDPQYKSEWRLFPLIDCLFQTGGTAATPPNVAQTELKRIEQLEANVRQELTNLPRFSRHDCKTIKFKQDPNGCPFLDVQQQEQQPLSFHYAHIKTEVKQELDIIPTLPEEKRFPLMSANRIKQEPHLLPMSASEQSPSTSLDSNPACYSRRTRRRMIMPRSGSITLAQIEQLQKENELLKEQRDMDLADLKLMEREYQLLEQKLDSCLHRNEVLLNYMDTYLVKRGTI
ncbi:uncharacterized protein LOC6561751 [Drosophila grimshawi]|uniref:GH10813 n=1 Tax=Drosophila grimshawi TaxID=7222 RepID=B4JAY3_DROGR|nr:uncharacterized protein LOC6561751 [Drosophila grimshawi]EDW02853.1 GH10813 [Drosophila grimshawi]